MELYPKDSICSYRILYNNVCLAQKIIFHIFDILALTHCTFSLRDVAIILKVKIAQNQYCQLFDSIDILDYQFKLSTTLQNCSKSVLSIVRFYRYEWYGKLWCSFTDLSWSSFAMYICNWRSHVKLIFVDIQFHRYILTTLVNCNIFSMTKCFFIISKYLSHISMS